MVVHSAAHEGYVLGGAKAGGRSLRLRPATSDAAYRPGALNAMASGSMASMGVLPPVWSASSVASLLPTMPTEPVRSNRPFSTRALAHSAARVWAGGSCCAAARCLPLRRAATAHQPSRPSHTPRHHQTVLPKPCPHRRRGSTPLTIACAQRRVVYSSSSRSMPMSAPMRGGKRDTRVMLRTPLERATGRVRV